MANGGNGLFAAKEFQKGETIGFYAGNVCLRVQEEMDRKAVTNIWQMKELLLGR
jgi:hypothetical protein